MQRQNRRENVKRSIQKGASNVGRGIWGATKYVGRVAGRKLREGVERTFNEPINPRDREAFERARESSERRYWQSQARQEYRKSPRYTTPAVSMFGGGRSSVTNFGGGRSLGVSMVGGTPMVSGKKKKEVSMI